MQNVLQEFDVRVDGQTLELAVVEPSRHATESAKRAYRKAHAQALAVGNLADDVQAEAKARELGQWDDARQARSEELVRFLVEGEKRLDDGILSEQERRALAEEMRRARDEALALRAGLRRLGLQTAYAKGMRAAFDCLVTHTVVRRSDLSHYYKSVEDYHSGDLEVGLASAKVVARTVFDATGAVEDKVLRAA